MRFLGDHRARFFAAMAALALSVCAVPAFAAGGAARAGVAAGFWQAADAAKPQLTQSVGTVKAISGNTLTLKLDSGNEITVNVADSTKMVQMAPGQKDLKSATAIHVTDLQVGDRILVRNRASDDPKNVTAVGIIAMKSTDVAAKQARDREDWQRRGVGGIVKSVDAAAGTVMISEPAVAGVSKMTVITTTKSTVLRRYAPDSVKFDDAKPAPIGAIQVGDQLRARGEKNADGTQFAAAEIVSGTFRNIAGTITAVDASAKTISMMDLIAKKPVMVRVTDETQLKKMPPEMALRIALRLRGAGAAGAGVPGAGGGGGGNEAARSNGGSSNGNAGAAGGGQRPGGAGGGGGRPDFQQIVNRLPASALTDFQKGDAVLVVSTEGTNEGGVTAITVVGGVDAIMAAPGGGASAAATLSPWSLGGAPGGDTGGIQ
jgi:hypothetical protein